MNQRATNIYELSYRLSQELFLDDNGDDLFIVDQFSFGKLSQTQLFHVILDVLSKSAATNRSSSIFSSAGIAAWSKRNCLDWQIKEQLARFSSISGQIGSGCDIVAIYDVRNGGMIDTLMRVCKVLEQEKQVVALAFEPRVYSTVKNVHSKSIPYPKGIRDWDRKRAQLIRTELLSRYRARRGELQKRVDSALSDSSIEVLHYLNRLFARFYRQAARDFIRVSTLLEQLQPKLIIAASDCHKFSRMFALLARRYGAGSLVIQHGATISPHGYVPVYADKFAAWGKLSADWLIERDVPKEKIVITGQPRLDRLVEFIKEKETGSPKASRRILVATNPIPDQQNEALVKIITEGLRAFAFEVDLTFKLHPGQSQLELFRRLCYQNQLNCRIEARGDLYRMISESDIVITTQSTVGIEALALGLDLVIVDFPGLQTAIPYTDYQCVYRVANGAEMADALRYHLTDSDPWPAIRSKRDEFIADYLYKIDGHATDRVARLALDMMTQR